MYKIIRVLEVLVVDLMVHPVAIIAVVAAVVVVHQVV